MPYYVPGAPIAASQHTGANQTDIFTVNTNGQLCVMTVQGAGTWSSPLPLTPDGFALAGSFVAASPEFGADGFQTDVFVVDKSGTLQAFTAGPEGSSWRSVALSEPGAFAPGPQSFAVMPDNLSKTPVVNRIDVFIFDQDGILRCYHRDAGQPWTLQILFELGSKAANVPLAAAFRVSNSQVIQELHLVFVDSTGILNWITNASGSWKLSPIPQGGSAFTAYANVAVCVRYGTATKHTDSLDDLNVFGIDDAGRLVCYSMRSNVWQWTPITFREFAITGTPVCANRQFIQGVFQTDVFVVGKDKSLNVFFSQNGDAWSPRPPISTVNVGSHLTAAQQVGAPSTDDAFQTDLFVCDSDHNVSVFYIFNQTSWQRLQLPTPFDPQISQLGSNTNVVFYAARSSFTALQAEILITEDLVPGFQIDAYGNQVGGLSIQFNCWSPKGDAAYWQQYGFALAPGGGGALTTFAQNWGRSATGLEYIIMETFPGLTTLPASPSPRIPAGYRLKFVLTTTPYGDAINGVEFYAYDSKNALIGQVHIDLLKLELLGPGGKSLGPVKEVDLSRVFGFQLDLVGDGAGQFSQFTSGAGTITYSVTGATSELLPVVTPDGVLPTVGTGESSNIIYSTVPNESGRLFTQQFQIKALADATQVIVPFLDDTN
jgi:hypothetical protein